MPLIPALGRLRQEDGKFTASLGYKGTSHFKKSFFHLRFLNVMAGELAFIR
jgi:hypothetical protein